MRAEQEPRHCRYCGEPFTPSRSNQRFCRRDCRISHYKLGGASEQRLQALIRPVIADLLKDESFLRELKDRMESTG